MEAGFRAACRWLYRDTLEHVRGKSLDNAARRGLSDEYLNDIANMRAAYLLLIKSGEQA
jgi:hypothetical protein